MSLWRTLGVFTMAAAALQGAGSKLALIGSQHDLSVTGSGPVKSTGTDACIFCHAPHNVKPNVTPLWDHALSGQTYTTYTSSTYDSGAQSPASGSSKLCLSCHDGTVALGLTVTKGLIPTTGSMIPADNFGTDLSTGHPVSMTPADDGSLAPSLFANPPTTRDASVKLVAGKVECTTCHDPHAPRNDPVVPMFLARSNSGGAICLACHDPTRSQPNALNGWTSGAHATAPNTVPANAAFGQYGDVSANACWSCHNAHNNGVGARSLKAVEEAACSSCHSGSNVTPVLRNVIGEYSKTYSHPTLRVSGAHDAAESLPVEKARHAECADCHNSHAAAASTGTPLPPSLQAPLAGARGYDTTGPQAPATREYQVCFQCHSDSTNKPQNSAYVAFGGHTPVRYAGGTVPGTTQPTTTDPFNQRLEFNGTISHNVMGNSVVTITSPSATLRPFMKNSDGSDNTSRPLTTSSMLYCTDCHDNNDARSANGAGPNGPHASTFSHLLQRLLYQDPISATGGGNGNNTAAGMALCDKCHVVSTVQGRSPHNEGEHRRAGCTTCHDPHGVINGNPAASRALMNFDTQVVTRPSVTANFGYYYLGSGNNQKGCYVRCHGKNHNPCGYNDCP